MKDKKKERAAVKQTRSKRMTEAKRQLKDKQKGTKNQEEMLLQFMASRKEEELTLAKLELVWAFIFWLDAEGYRILNDAAVVCVPVKYLVEPSTLK